MHIPTMIVTRVRVRLRSWDAAMVHGVRMQEYGGHAFHGATPLPTWTSCEYDDEWLSLRRKADVMTDKISYLRRALVLALLAPAIVAYS